MPFSDSPEEEAYARSERKFPAMILTEEEGTGFVLEFLPEEAGGMAALGLLKLKEVDQEEAIRRKKTECVLSVLHNYNLI